MICHHACSSSFHNHILLPYNYHFIINLNCAKEGERHVQNGIDEFLKLIPELESAEFATDFICWVFFLFLNATDVRMRIDIGLHRDCFLVMCLIAAHMHSCMLMKKCIKRILVQV